MDMKFDTDRWMTLEDGRKYLGETDVLNLVPEGLGIVQLSEGTYYAGEFKSGEMSGRGMILTCEEWDSLDEVWHPGSYEEVMATASFDQCGRVTHVDRVGTWQKEKRHHIQWHKDKDGYWYHNEFQREMNRGPLGREPWCNARTTYLRCPVYHGKCDYLQCYQKDFDSLTMGGEYSFNNSAFVTLYDDLHILVCTYNGHILMLAPGEQLVTYSRRSDDETEEHVITLSLGNQYQDHIRLMIEAWTEIPQLPVPKLYQKALASVIFGIRAQGIPGPEDYARALSEAFPKITHSLSTEGALMIQLKSDIWTIERTPSQVWLYSATGKKRIRLTGRDPESVAYWAAHQDDILQEVQDQLKKYREAEESKLLQSTEEALRRAFPIGSEHFWGFADLPDEVEYPYNGEDNPMTLICQFRLDSGMVSVFADLDYFFGNYDVDGGHIGEWDEHLYRVIYTPTTDNLHTHEIRNADGSWGVPKPIAPDKMPKDNMSSILQKPHYFEEEVQQDYPGWLALVQLDEDDALGLRFYDCGCLYFLIRPEDLEQRDFSRVKCVLYSC